MRIRLRTGLVRSALPILALIAIASCYSSSYRKGLAANVALISDLTDKLTDYCRSGFMLNGRAVSSEEMGEFYYALKKARSFGAMNESLSDQPSYKTFQRLLDSYQGFVQAADQFRLNAKPDPPALEALMGREREVKELARQTLDASHAESR